MRRDKYNRMVITFTSLVFYFFYLNRLTGTLGTFFLLFEIILHLTKLIFDWLYLKQLATLFTHRIVIWATDRQSDFVACVIILNHPDYQKTCYRNFTVTLSLVKKIHRSNNILVVLRLMRRNLISETDIRSLIKHAMKTFKTGNSKFNCFKTCN